MNSTHSLQSILNSGNNLDKIFVKSQQLQSINDLLATLLPETLKPHCWASNIENGTLTLGIDNTIWMMQFRALSTALLETLRQETGLAHLIQIKIKVQLLDDIKCETSDSHPIQANISQESAEALQAMAEETKNEKLSAVLLRLAKRATH